MKTINFTLLKNKNILIQENNIKCLENSDKIIFKINDIKYTYDKYKLTKETQDEIIYLDFNNKKASIYLKKHGNNLILELTDVRINKTKEIEEIEYKIETENNIINIIKIEYIKNS